MSLTDAKLRAAKPQAKTFTLSDERGLYVEVFPTGGKVWRYRFSFDGKREKLTLGKYPDLTLKAARLARDKAARSVAAGINPVEEKRNLKSELAIETVEQFAAQFLKEVGKVRKNPEPELARWRNDILPHIGSMRLDELNHQIIWEVIKRKKEEGFDQAAKLILGSLKRFSDYAVTCGHLPLNPAASIKPKHVAQNRSRERALTEAELGTFLSAIDSTDLHLSLKHALRLLTLTLVRKGELRRALWQDVHFDRAEWHIPAENSKTGKPHIVYLSKQACESFESLQQLAGGSEFVLPGRWGRKPYAEATFNNALKEVLAGKGVEDVTVHDLRRTGATQLAELGFNPDVIEKALNHTIKGIKAVYNRAEYAEQRREMLQAWADFCDLKSGASK